MGGSGVSVSENDDKFIVSVGAPVISEGDVMGCVLFVAPKDAPPAGEIECRLAQTVAAFLGKQMES
jgi:AbrB family transcriptional regulator (stage V sporulation protein T)